MTYDPQNAKFRDTVPHLALLIVAYSLVRAYQGWCSFIAIGDKSADDAIKKHFLTAFPLAPSSGDEGEPEDVVSGSSSPSGDCRARP